MDFGKVLTAMKVASSIIENEGRVNHDTIMTAVFDRRMSDDKTFLSSWNSLVLCNHDDFPLLKHYQMHSFQSGKNTLYGYHYHQKKPKGLILYVHGIGGSAFDWYAIGQNEWVKRGYDVFAIELTASGFSKGFGIAGLHQSALDVAAAVEYIKSNRDLQGYPLFLFGHSWGGYGVSASLHFNQNINAVAELSGFATPAKEMMGFPEAKLNGISLGDPKPIEDALERRAGEVGNLSAVTAIQSYGVPVIAVHGGRDEVVPYKEASILNECQGFANVKPIYLADRDHVNVFFSDYACAMRAHAFELLKEPQKQYGKDLTNVNEEQRQAIASQIDRFACSETNVALFDEIDYFFQDHR